MKLDKKLARKLGLMPLAASYRFHRLRAGSRFLYSHGTLLVSNTHHEERVRTPIKVAVEQERMAYIE